MMLLLGLSLLIRTAVADLQLYPNNTLTPSNTLSPSCLSAMNATIACDPYLVSLAATDYFGSLNDDDLQTSVCAPTCGSSLSKYHSSVKEACSKDPVPWDGVSAIYYGDFIWAQYNLTCIRDPASKQWCNGIHPRKAKSNPKTQKLTVTADYVSNLSIPDGDTELTALPKAQLCSPCIIALAQHIQGTAFSNYDTTIATQWQSVQSTCGLDLPTDVQPPAVNGSILIPGYAQENTTQPAACLSGKTYNVVSGDNPEKIADAHDVATGTLAILNGLLPDGSNLLAGAKLCLPQPCQTYVVQPGDLCATLASSQGLSYAQFRAYNPSINLDCSNLLAGTRICLSLPGPAYSGTTINGATVTKTAAYASATVPAPSHVASGTTRKCGKYYKVQAGDFCQKVAINNTIALPLFQAINPSIDATCSNLATDVFYCVFPTQDWNATLTVTQSPPTTTPTGTTSQCYEWHTVVENDTCSSITDTYGIAFAQFRTWNPSIDDDCLKLLLGDAYCVNGPGKATSASVSQPAPSPTATAGGRARDLETRDLIREMHLRGWEGKYA